MTAWNVHHVSNRKMSSTDHTVIPMKDMVVDRSKSGTLAGFSKHNESLDREVVGCRNVVLYSFIFIMLETWKQVTTYGMKYYNNDEYPLPQTLVIAITELLKFLIFALIVCCSGTKIHMSFWYAVPSIIYAINNNIYYFALHYATPPMWSILIQLRIPFTALTYRMFFNRTISALQWVALVMLITALMLSNLTGGQTMTGEDNLSIALILAVVGSATSVIGTITMEYLFKNDSRGFAEMQMQLYLFGTIACWTLYGVEWFRYPTRPDLKHDYTLTATTWQFLYFLVVMCIILSVCSGTAVAVVIKKLDNIVKLYSQALANMLTSVACTFLFPDHFHLNLYFTGCLLLMFLAIFIYENKNWSLEDVWELVRSGVTAHRGKTLLLLSVGGTLFIVYLLFLNGHIDLRKGTTIGQETGL